VGQGGPDGAALFFYFLGAAGALPPGPAAFGGTPSQGEWQVLQEFLRRPTDVDGTATKLEAAAAKAFGH